MFKTLLKTLLTGTLITAIFLPALSSADEKKELNFGIISTEASQNLKEVWQPFLDDMGEELNLEIRAFFASDYAGIIQAMRFGKVDVAWFGNKSAMQAVDRADGEIFVQTVDIDGSPGYWSLLITHKDSPLNNVEDIIKNAKDLTFGNGDPNSTSGFLVPYYYVFVKYGIDPKRDFKRTLNSNHQTNLLAAVSKKVDFATNNTRNLRRFEVTHPDKVKNIKILWKSPLIPADPIVWNKNLDEVLKQNIYDFFMGYGTKDEAEKAVLASLQWAPFKASSNDQLLPIRQLALFKKRLEITNDKKLSTTEKEPKLAEIDMKLNSIKRRVAALKNYAESL